jgi:hypothetical protein
MKFPSSILILYGGAMFNLVAASPAVTLYRKTTCFKTDESAVIVGNISG